MNLDKQLLPQDFQISLACSFLRFSLCFHIASPCSYTSARTCPAPRIMALDLNFIDGFNREVGEQDAGLTFEEACAHVQGQKIIGPLSKPLKCDRPADADIVLLDLPLRNTVENGGKLEQFADLILNHPVEVTQDFLDNTLYKLCAQNKFRDLPEPFCFKSEPNVPYSIQIIVRPALRPPDQEKKYFDILKHIYLHRNKVFSKDILTYCHGHALRFDWGQQVRTGLMAFNYMFDRVGGMQIRLWTIAPKFEKKHAREEGYKFIRDHGPRSNNKNQFMEWTDEQVHMPGGKIEGWNEGKVKEALNNYYRGRQNAKTLEYWPFTLKSSCAWFLDGVLVKMLPTMRQHAITWIAFETSATASCGYML